MMQGFLNDLKGYLQDVLDIHDVTYHESFGEYTLQVPLPRFLETIGYLKHSAKFLQLTDITAVDFPKRPQRFDVVYHLLNMHRNVRVRVKVMTDATTPVPSLCRIYKCANWYEREIFDMFGISFDQHPNLNRILTDYTFDAFPMRKDFPTEGRMEVHYDEVNRCVVYDPINLPQAKRQFDFMVNKWFSPVYETPKSEGGPHGA